ncbi:MAG: type 2 isopentenyl-diphosphate Delta-isomerase [Euryarchaeota archaeon]|nr:type 2 isopentenyl-diphosphate Delta-isomerase [Euryarchaeota archaeon]
MTDGAASRIAGRKRDHLRIHLENDVQAGGDVWRPYRLRHDALPEVDRDKVDLRTRFLGTDIGGPLLISGMTGGCDEAEHVNDHLAAAAAEYRVPMGVGSQRAALAHRDLRRSYEVVKDHDVPLVLANLGAPQLVEWGAKTALAKAEEAIAMVEADVLALHLNYLQECVQPEGDTLGAGVTDVLAALVDDLDVPVLVKETGAGIGGDVARRLVDVGVAAIDVGGLGGTSFSAVEMHRALAEEDALHERIGRTFYDWGVPTPWAVEECVTAVGAEVPIAATGGVRHGLDGAIALALGATLFGMAGAMLRAADRSQDAARAEVRAVLEEVRTALFLTGSADLASLRRPGVWLERPAPRSV